MVLPRVYIIENDEERTETMTKEELKKLFGNEAFVEKLKEVDSIETLQKFLADNGLNMSLDEINKAIKSDEELNEQELNDIPGGGWFGYLSFAWKCFTWHMIECE